MNGRTCPLASAGGPVRPCSWERLFLRRMTA